MRTKQEVYQGIVDRINEARQHIYGPRVATLDPVWFNRLSQAIRDLENFTQAVQAVGGAS